MAGALGDAFARAGGFPIDLASRLDRSVGCQRLDGVPGSGGPQTRLELGGDVEASAIVDNLTVHLESFGDQMYPEVTVSHMDTGLGRVTTIRFDDCPLPAGAYTLGFDVDADATRLRRIILNLAANAVDVMPRGGKITIAVSRVEGADDRDRVQLTVTDNGPGVPEELRHRLFEPFVSSRRGGRGAGLGLAVVYEMPPWWSA